MARIRREEKSKGTRVFTTGILFRKGRILILKRRDDDDTYPGKWDCLGGHLLEHETAEDCMVREAMEESGLLVKIKRAGHAFEQRDEYGRAVAIPYMLGSSSDKVVLTEHTAWKWVRPSELEKHDCAPDLTEAVRRFGLIE